MKYFTFTILILLANICPVRSQDNGRQMANIRAAQVAYITDKLSLTPEQAEKFWPVYNEFSSKRFEIRREYRDLRRSVGRGQTTREESEKMVELGLKMKEREVKLEREYSERFMRVVGPAQVVALRKAEDDFKKMLMRRIQQKQQRRQQNQQMRQQQQRRQERLRRLKE